MEPTHVIEHIKQHNIQSDWVVYRYHIIREIWFFFVKLVYVVLFLSMTIFLFYYIDPKVDYMPLFFALLLLLGTVVSFIYLINHLRRMWYMSSNMLVLTGDSVIRSLAGKVEQFYYSEITQVELVRIHGQSRPVTIFPEVYIQFDDQKTGKKIELVRNSIFGRPDKIYQKLMEKLGYK